MHVPGKSLRVHHWTPIAAMALSSVLYAHYLCDGVYTSHTACTCVCVYVHACADSISHCLFQQLHNKICIPVTSPARL